MDLLLHLRIKSAVNIPNIAKFYITHVTGYKNGIYFLCNITFIQLKILCFANSDYYLFNIAYYQTNTIPNLTKYYA